MSVCFRDIRKMITTQQFSWKLLWNDLYCLCTVIISYRTFYITLKCFIVIHMHVNARFDLSCYFKHRTNTLVSILDWSYVLFSYYYLYLILLLYIIHRFRLHLHKTQWKHTLVIGSKILQMIYWLLFSTKLDYFLCILFFFNTFIKYIKQLPKVKLELKHKLLQNQDYQVQVIRFSFFKSLSTHSIFNGVKRRLERQLT